ncbi:hypothetical protein RFI_04910 [Reticulomyxa filosa]|uniref:PPPDE domain-containing protein n=1 Tax=Reticulomyxa filosa TaxID=46433 RepID=X6P1U5_RETFI|nr:hypothetical protein RFI_04910 [Reticulomyxa filosa]|eukprot:ETO32206.1 hypothetical protein RFI_04910 [Reticulomyxa filosa]
MFTELDEFLKYYVPNDKGDFIEMKHTILACVLPTLPLPEEEMEKQKQQANAKKESDTTDILFCGIVGDDMYHTPEKITEGLDLYREKGEESGFIPAKCSEKTVADIITFLEKWSTEHDAYNALSCNCQTFAHDLYSFLIGSHYKNQLPSIVQYLQSFVDFDREWKRLEDESKQDESNKAPTEEQAK